jgi:amidase
MVPIAHGNDGGGSIRIPAACCGLVGLKTARGRISLGPEIGDAFLLCEGVLTRDVADTTAALDLLAGYEPGDSTWAPPPSAPFAELAAREPGRLRVGLALNPPLEGVTVDPVCEHAVRDAGTLLESLGHQVELVTPPWSEQNLLSDFTRIWAPLISMTTLIGGAVRGKEPTEDDVEPLTWVMWENAHATDGVGYLSTESRMKSLARSLVAFLEPYDVVVTPALAARPVRIGEIHGLGPDPWGNYQRSGHFTPFTAICNVTGQPAIALPLYQADDGLPLAIQLIGRPLREDVLLSLSGQLEQALPWSDRLAPLAAG